MALWRCGAASRPPSSPLSPPPTPLQLRLTSRGHICMHIVRCTYIHSTWCSCSLAFPAGRCIKYNICRECAAKTPQCSESIIQEGQMRVAACPNSWGQLTVCVCVCARCKCWQQGKESRTFGGTRFNMDVPSNSKHLSILRIKFETPHSAAVSLYIHIFRDLYAPRSTTYFVILTSIR